MNLLNNFQNTTNYFQKCFFLLYSNLIYINLHMGWLGDNQSASSSRNFPQISCKNFLQHFPELDPDWLAPITLFQMLNFHQSLPFLNWLFPLHPVPKDFPARFSHMIFWQDFPNLDPDWLASHHPIPNAKFPPITAFLQLAFSPPSCPARFSHKIFPPGSWLVGSPSPYSKC